MKTLPFLLCTFFLLSSFATSAQLFSKNKASSSSLPIAIKFDFTRPFHSIRSWQPSVEVKLLQNISFETELNFYGKFEHNTQEDLALGAMQTKLVKKPNFFVTGILKFNRTWSNFYIGVRGGIGRIHVEYQRVVCFETQESLGGLCQCTDWGDVKVNRTMKQYMLGGRLGYQPKLGEHFVFDFYMDITSIKYIYPVAEKPLLNSLCGRMTDSVFDELPFRNRALVDKMFWLNSGEFTALFQIGLKLGYAF